MMGNTYQFAWEVSLIEWCQTHIPTFAINALSIISEIGDILVMVLLLGFFYLCFDKRVGKKLLFTTFISFQISGVLKNIAKRRRPYFDNKNIECLKVVDSNYDKYDLIKQGFSFPSMHSSNIVVTTGTLYQRYKKRILLIVSIVLSLIIGISRFVLGCHYPTDVLAGWLLGIVSIIVIGKLQDKASEKWIYIIILAFTLIGFFICDSDEFYTMSGISIGFIGCCIFDNKVSKFKNTRNIIKSVLRLVLSSIAFLAISEGLKLIFPTEVLEAGTLFAHFYRLIRYAIAMFVSIGLIPNIYKYNILKLKD